KVLILTITENDMPSAVQKMVSDSNSEINSDDASKLIGCINALSKRILGDAGVIAETDPEPMRRAVGFCQNIKASKKITHAFNSTTGVYYDSLSEENREKLVAVNSDHIDGTMSAPLRDEKMGWLKSQPENSRECRLLTNVRCLSEGVDVPTLDSVLFLSARNSQVDVVQSVGRVMRKAPEKRYGYIIIPIVVPANIEPDKALDDNERYKIVWTVLNALRAHDDRFNAIINKIELNKNKPHQIIIGRIDPGKGDGGDGEMKKDKLFPEISRQLVLQYEQLQNVILARLVLKCGDRRYWEAWANDVARIAERYVERITRLIQEDGEHKKAFASFLTGLQKNINPSISECEAVEMLAQHIITKPVFEALFESYSFVKNNPISVSMQMMLDLLEAQSLEKDTETLQKFYESVKMRAGGIDNAEARQRIIVELYDKFFKTAFPKMVEKLGIVYTPVEVVDFIIHSVDDILKKEFGRSISDENIHILDPFTGTGTFITRLLQSGLIKPTDLERKYKKEIHANEIVLLAYYIAAINIENAYHDAHHDKDTYKPFDGICLTDTFQLGETDASERLFSEMFPQNSARVEAQKKAPLRVIMGNPPYSIGQKSANDNAQNQKYEKLDARIEATYAKGSKATSIKALYDSYIKAFRWSSDRLDKEHGGIIAFVSNGGWLDTNGMDGFRKCLEKEFSAIYVFNLRGNQRTSGELSRKEGGKIFGSGSRTPIAITFLVKNPQSESQKAVIRYKDIGDYLSREAKLTIIERLKSTIDSNVEWQIVTPNDHGDWISQRNDAFSTFIQLAPEKKFDSTSKTYFVVYSLGINSNRDAWVYNSSKTVVKNNMKKMVAYYNDQVDGYKKTKNQKGKIRVEDFIDTNPQKISWSSSLIPHVEKGNIAKYEPTNIVVGCYRPFYKQNLYIGDKMIHRRGQFDIFFPDETKHNVVICVSGLGGTKEDTIIITDTYVDLNCLDAGAQCFPLYYYEERKDDAPTIFDNAESENNYVKRDGVSDFILQQARKAYGNKVTKEDIFYYVYGILHSREYRTQFSADLKKMLPRIPLVDESIDFWSFSKAGRKLAELHINYETVPPAVGVIVTGAKKGAYKVEKMRFPSKKDKSK
ncbi:MAG TPA: type ISP restriction/modification enzyme, partial [Nitrosomonas sp.]|nr:type ISP restriction/modification enzyme [Nitrosomonas sp.]